MRTINFHETPQKALLVTLSSSSSKPVPILHMRNRVENRCGSKHGPKSLFSQHSKKCQLNYGRSGKNLHTPRNRSDSLRVYVGYYDPRQFECNPGVVTPEFAVLQFNFGTSYAVALAVCVKWQMSIQNIAHNQFIPAELIPATADRSSSNDRGCRKCSHMIWTRKCMHYLYVMACVQQSYRWLSFVITLISL